jgi:hypothetical protein
MSEETTTTTTPDDEAILAAVQQLEQEQADSFRHDPWRAAGNRRPQPAAAAVPDPEDVAHDERRDDELDPELER